jgi:glycosyltransferase involved in cell wall biosynthesis
MTVPIRIGGGTRIKIAEAFSKKCPVVSTSLGAFGYDVVDRQDLMLADTAQDFASACLSLIKDENLGSILSENGWEAFLRHWTWESMFPAVSRVVEECLREDQGITRQVPIVKSHDKSIQRRSNF